MEKYIDGADSIIFTSRTSNPIITLKAQAGKTLAIEGSSQGLGASNLSSTKTSSELEFYDFGSATTLSDNKSELVALSDNNHLIVAGEKILDSPGGKIWNYSAGVWSQSFLIETVISSSPCPVQHVAINEDGTQAAVSWQDPVFLGSTFVYTRSGPTWTESPTRITVGGASLSASGTRILIGKSGQLQVYNGTTLEQTIWTEESGLPYSPVHACMTGTGSLLVYGLEYPYDAYIRVNRRSGTVWTETDRLYLRQGDLDIKGLACRDRTIVCCTSNHVYTWDYNTNPDSAWVLKKIISAPVSTVHKVLLVSNGTATTKMALYATGTVYRYSRDLESSNFMYIGSTALSNDTGYSLTGSFAATAQQPLTQTSIKPLIAVDPVTTITVQELSLTDEATITSTERVNVTTDMVITGDLTVTNAIAGSLEASLAQLSNSTAWLAGSSLRSDLLPNNTLTELTLFEVADGSKVVPITNGTITTVTSGIYEVSATATFEANATGYRELRITTNTQSNTGLLTRLAPLSGIETVLEVSGLIKCQTGEEIQVKARQNSGSDLLCALLKFSAVYVGA